MHPEYKEGEYKEINTATSSSTDSQAATSAKAKAKNVNPEKPASQEKNQKQQTHELLRELINIYCEVFPDNPQPHQTVISTTLEKSLLSMIKHWPQIAEGKQVTVNGFRDYMEALKREAPSFSLSEYETSSGRRKKNGLETFARFNTMVKFSEGAYS